MAKKVYQAQVGKESKTAKAIIKNANISLKYSTEISNQFKGMYLDKAVAKLERIAAHEEYLPLMQYHKKVAHRKGDATNGVKSGRYPEKTVAKYLELFALVKNNADSKGLDVDNLNIIHMFASKGMSRHSYQSNGKIAGKARRVNATHIEVIVSEVKK